MFLACPVNATPCAAESGAGTAALVELYTAEACSRCIAAEQRVESLQGNVVRVVLYQHERGANRDALLQRRRLTVRQRLAMASTPFLMLQGRALTDWQVLERSIAGINTRPAQAGLRIEILGREGAALTVRAAAEALAPGALDQAVLYLAAYEKRASGTAAVVHEWHDLGRLSGGPGERRALVLPSGKLADGVVAWVQDRRTAEVLQALSLPACP